MNGKFFKYIFFVFVVGILIFASYKANQKSNVEIKQENNIQGQLNSYESTEINLGIAAFDNMNPIISNNKYVQEISKLIFDSLLNLDETYKIQTGLAKDWAKTSSNTYVIKLKDNVYWSNGEKFTATDVKFTIDKIKELGGVYSANVGNITNVEIVDSYTIKINLEHEQNFFEYNLTFPILSKANYGENSLDSVTPLGTGMYQISKQEGNLIKLEKNAKWWNKSVKDPIIDEINITLFSSVGEYYNAFKLGQIDLVVSNNTNIEEYIGTLGYNKKEFKGREFDFLVINTQNDLLSNIEVRKAINYAINKDSIIGNVYNNKYFRTKYPLDFGSWLYSGNSDSEYNIDLARSTLEESGWEYKYKYWQRYENYVTKRLSFSLLVRNSNAQMVQTAELIQGQLEELGLRINLVKASDSQYENAVINKAYDLALFGKNISANPDISTYVSGDNFANYENQEIDPILEETKNITDEKVLKEKYSRIEAIYYDEQPYISLYNNYYVVAYSTSLRGNITSNWYNIFYNFENWHK